MAAHPAAAALTGKRKMLSAAFAPAKSASEGEGKNLSAEDSARAFSRLMHRTLELAEKTPQDLQGALSYANQGSVSKLMNPVEASPLMRALALGWFADALLVALAEQRRRSVRVKTVIEIERTA